MDAVVTQAGQQPAPSPARGSSPPPKIRIAPGPAESDPGGFQRRRRRREFILAWVAPLVMFALWEWAAKTNVINPRYFPPPSDIWSAAVELAKDGSLQDNVLVTARRVVLGFFIGGVVGVFLGLVLGTWRSMRVAFGPILSALYTVPKIALLPMFLLIFGLGETSRIAVIVVTVFFFMWISTQEAIVSVPNGYLEAAQSFRANRMQLFRHVVIPAALPGMFVGLQISAGVSVLVVIGIEFVQGGNGLGHLIWFSWSLFRPDRMYVGIIAAGLMGFLFTSLVRVAGRRLLPWAKQEPPAAGGV